MGAGEGRIAAADDPARHFLEEVSSGDKDWVDISELLGSRSKDFTTRYHYTLKLKKLWRVVPSERLQQHEAKAKELGKPTQLFHGTSAANALTIVKDGFKLPEKRGMFGRGVYFAETPLKSARFAPDDSKWSLRRLFQEGPRFGDNKEGHLLLCDVHLGNSKTLRKAAANLNPAEDLKPPWPLQQLRNLGVSGIEDYNSVYVPGGWFGAVNVSEYVVYQEHQGLPRYLVEFEYER